jgi:hypothetical protein
VRSAPSFSLFAKSDHPERKPEMTLASETSQIADHWASREPLQENGGFHVSPLLRPYIIETAFGKDQVEAHRANAFYSIDILSRNFSPTAR